MAWRWLLVTDVSELITVASSAHTVRVCESREERGQEKTQTKPCIPTAKASTE
jgi:hypothetical protein